MRPMNLAELRAAMLGRDEYLCLLMKALAGQETADHLKARLEEMDESIMAYSG